MPFLITILSLSGLCSISINTFATLFRNVGFLKYYEMKQLPNFLLASPMLALSLWGICSFFHRVPLFTTSTKQRRAGRKNSPVGQTTITHHTDGTAASGSSSGSPFYQVEVYPYILYWAFLVTVGLLFMHVQVITRFLSHCPAVYWFAAQLLDPSKRRRSYSGDNKVRLSQKGVLLYFVAYSLVGPLLFCNFYPWT